RIVGPMQDLGQAVGYVEETKTASSRRNISLPAFLAELLQKHLANAPASDFVFVRPDGTWLRRTGFRRVEWKPALAAAGLDPALRFHDYADPRVMPTSWRGRWYAGVERLKLS